MTRPRMVHPIEARSYQILRARVDTSGLPPLTRAVVERVIHASADVGYFDDLVISAEAHLRTAVAALRAGVPVVTDADMVAAGITTVSAVCRVRQAVPVDGLTRSAAAVRLAYREVGPGAIWAVGNAPTALAELLRLDVGPTLVIGLPVGFVGAVEAKQALRDSGLPAVSNVSEKGGSAVAAAAVNALLYADTVDADDPPPHQFALDGFPPYPPVPDGPPHQLAPDGPPHQLAPDGHPPRQPAPDGFPPYPPVPDGPPHRPAPDGFPPHQPDIEEDR